MLDVLYLIFSGEWLGAIKGFVAFNIAGAIILAVVVALYTVYSWLAGSEGQEEDKKD